MTTEQGNRARMYTSTTGTTSPLVLTSAVSGFQTFDEAEILEGVPLAYTIEDENGAWEITEAGIYTKTGLTLTRVPVESSNSDALISLSGSAQVFVAGTPDSLASPKNAQSWTAGQQKGIKAKAAWNTAWSMRESFDWSVTAQVASVLTFPLPDDVRNAIVTDQGHWSAQVYALNDLVRYHRRLWVASGATTAGQVPGVDAVWLPEALGNQADQEGTIFANFGAASGAVFNGSYVTPPAGIDVSAGGDFLFYYRIQRLTGAAPKFFMAQLGPWA